MAKRSTRSAKAEIENQHQTRRMSRCWFSLLVKRIRFHFLYRSTRNPFFNLLFGLWFSEMTSLRQGKVLLLSGSAKDIHPAKTLDAVFSSSPNQSFGTLFYCVYCLCLFSQLHPAAPPVGWAFFHVWFSFAKRKLAGNRFVPGFQLSLFYRLWIGLKTDIRLGSASFLLVAIPAFPYCFLVLAF